VIILTAIPSPTDVSTQIEQFGNKRVNAHLLDYLPKRKSDDNLAKLTIFGSYRWIPTNVINGTGGGTYTAASGALHSIYSETKMKREKVLFCLQFSSILFFQNHLHYNILYIDLRTRI